MVIQQNSGDSAFNMSLAHLTRIDNILNLIVLVSAEENYPEWLKFLNTLSREVDFLFKKDELDEVTRLNNESAEAITRFNKTRNLNDKNLAYNKLVLYERYLKTQLADRKMLMKFGKNLNVAMADLS